MKRKSISHTDTDIKIKLRIKQTLLKKLDKKRKNRSISGTRYTAVREYSFSI
jgi:hypothetical protein